MSAVILAAAGYTMLKVVPDLGRSLRLLGQITTVDLPSLQMEGELHLRLAEDRAALIAFLGAPGQTETVEGLRLSDAAVVAAAAKVTGLGAEAQAGQQAFAENWKRYLQERSRLMEGASRGGAKAALAMQPDLGEPTYVAAQQAVRSAEIGQQGVAADRITEVARVLKRVTNELVLLVLMMLGGFSLIGWLAVRRQRAERELREAMQALEAQEKSFREAFDGSTVGMGIFNLDGEVSAVNRAGAGLLGYKPEELIGTKVAGIMAPEHREGHIKSITTAPSKSEPTYVAERRVICKDGGTAWVRNSVTLIRPEDAEPYFFSVSEEITAQKEAYDRLEWLANYDPVTGMPNRRFFEEEMASTLDAQANGGPSIALLYIEVDGFDFLKGTFGRRTADEVLAELGVELRKMVTASERIGRLDDYAFGMLMPSAAYEESAVKRADELLEVFRRMPELGARRIPLSASIGVVYADEGVLKTRMLDGLEHADSKTETMLKLARAAMLEARSRGGDVVQVADPALQDRTLQRHRIEAALLRGIHRDEFRVVFQPQFRVANGALVRFEALCRWDSAELGPIPPDRFIPIAEESGLMLEIGRLVMLDALKQAKRWTDAGRKIGISVNISPVQFMRQDFNGQLSEALAVTGFPPALLELEITEGIFIRDLNLAVARIRDLQRLGVSVALDDFGTGYSSLSYLQRMPIDAVKLDRSFVSELTTDESTVSMVRSVLAMARALDLRVVTEGVETREQLEILRQLGCEEAQGHLLGRPEEADVAYQRVMDSPRATVGLYA
ncbi:MAG TPA: EAL domain-containing protein [Acidobacteriaceae bacterium]|nr:EAL domain-containing protein [Acidobacteriaceae bacterium]